MDYSNPEIPEGINTSKQHPLKDFFILSASILGGIALCLLLLGLFVERLALHIPFSVEQRLIEKIELEDVVNSDPEAQDYLNKLSAQLLSYIELPTDITVTVNYIDDATENAFATLGGHISIYRGLIDLLPNENALAMVIAHEIAHIKYRDPVIALGRGVVIGLFLTTLAGLSTDHLINRVVTDTGTLTILGFSREQERRADEIALKALAKHYGHVNGADSLFNAFIKKENRIAKYMPEFFSTHPLSNNRIEEIHRLAHTNNWPIEGETTPLPVLLRKQ